MANKDNDGEAFLNNLAAYLRVEPILLESALIRICEAERPALEKAAKEDKPDDGAH